MPEKRVYINPVTRIEGHGKVSIYLDEKNRVKQAGKYDERWQHASEEEADTDDRGPAKADDDLYEQEMRRLLRQAVCALTPALRKAVSITRLWPFTR